MRCAALVGRYPHSRSMPSRTPIRTASCTSRALCAFWLHCQALDGCNLGLSASACASRHTPYSMLGMLGSSPSHRSHTAGFRLLGVLVLVSSTPRVALLSPNLGMSDAVRGCGWQSWWLMVGGWRWLLVTRCGGGGHQPLCFYRSPACIPPSLP